MNNFSIYKAAADVTSNAFEACKTEYDQRFNAGGYGYPGISIENTDTIQAVYNTLTPFLPDGVMFDSGPGTGVNYVNSIDGIHWHSDKPLYEYDDQFQLKPEFANRVCVGTVCVCTGGMADILIHNVDGSESTVPMTVGDILTIERDVEHRLMPTPSPASFVCLFVCSTE